MYHLVTSRISEFWKQKCCKMVSGNTEKVRTWNFCPKGHLKERNRGECFAPLLSNAGAPSTSQRCPRIHQNVLKSPLNPGRIARLNFTSFRSSFFDIISKSGLQHLRLHITIEFSQMYHLITSRISEFLKQKCCKMVSGNTEKVRT